MQKAEEVLEGDLLTFWRLIRIEPEKWSEEEFGKEGGGFWVVAIYGRKVIWYNDIEEGFNVSDYKSYGVIDDYSCEQDDLNWTLIKLYR
ncbi:hypothetical protein [Solitalea canadensis]|uniref:Uncharacterized protein n=1 Tax=Solitalea canadensis (strain ATCC 29591 / DSM 3403 / JCM 21819 / LMG 8368 / NBRC 15130 / NCIMB 12057 / USAM 9D) TaxID=929556 RepID=H8KU73_SOLCM|nr:hypothetical protein [Solitalea canadensis]AFD07185.1 hypothetical protein Solca_2131 [Solitalea canadensis DSM 3403]